MSERITLETIAARRHNVNRRLADRGSKYQYFTQRRNGHVALDRFDASEGGDPFVHSTVTVGTKREVADFLHAMMVALDDAACLP